MAASKEKQLATIKSGELVAYLHLVKRMTYKEIATELSVHQQTACNQHDNFARAVYHHTYPCPDWYHPLRDKRYLRARDIAHWIEEATAKFNNN